MLPKYMKICSVSALIKEMKIKLIITPPFLDIQIAKINQNNGKDAGKHKTNTETQSKKEKEEKEKTQNKK